MTIAPTNLADPAAGSLTVRPVIRVVLASAVAIGPLSIATGQLALPYSVTADGAEAAAGAAAHPDTMQAILWLDLLTTVTLLAGALVVCFITLRVAPRLGTAAAVSSVIGFGALAVTGFAFDMIAQTAAGPGSDIATTARIIDAAMAQPTATAALVAFLAGHLLALVLLGAAVWRGRAAPVWVAVALIVSGPLHVVFPGLVPGALVAALTWVLTAVAFGAVVMTAGRRPAEGA